MASSVLTMISVAWSDKISLKLQNGQLCIFFSSQEEVCGHSACHENKISSLLNRVLFRKLLKIFSMDVLFMTDQVYM